MVSLLLVWQFHAYRQFYYYNNRQTGSVPFLDQPYNSIIIFQLSSCTLTLSLYSNYNNSFVHREMDIQWFNTRRILTTLISSVSSWCQSREIRVSLLLLLFGYIYLRVNVTRLTISITYCTLH